MASLKVLAWNCGGLRSTSSVSRSKVMFFEKEFKTDFDIVFFIETHHKTSSEIPEEILRYQDTYHIIHSTVADDETHAGIIGLISKEYSIITSTDLIQGRILNLKIQHNIEKAKHNISAVYLNTNNNITRQKMHHIVNNLRLANEDHENNMILGDFNFIEHEKDKAIGLNSTDKMICKIWQPFTSELDIVDPFREQNPKRRLWSFIGTGAAGNSRIDRMYVNSVSINKIHNISYTPTPFRGHRILSFVKKGKSEKGKSYYKMNTSILHDVKYREIVQETKNELDDLCIKNDREKWEVFILTIRSKSLTYSKSKNRIKRILKNALTKQILEIEENGTEIENLLNYNFLTQKLKEIEDVEIEGYIRRIKYMPSHEKNEPDIAFYAKLEDKKIANDIIGQLAEDENSKIYTDKENIIKIATNFYKDLYTPNTVNTKTQDKLLKNIKTKLSDEQKDKLDAIITEEEIKTALFQMSSGKSPGLDGVPVEFYKEFWEEIKDIYIAYIRQVQMDGFSNAKNTSVIKLIYKKNGEIYLLTNYRPISLINVDIKILTKVLANRLKILLPHIIHLSQTAVYGRKIDQTVHMIRDLIDIANNEDEPAAFIFLDQEKAFDRVNHNFLYKTMKAFGIGDVFIQWIKTIYSNATAVLNINGFLTKPIPLKRGVRQGCPLSALLYVLVIEVLAIQLRINPNIVGFKIEGDKIVSAHYMDDTIIIIKQNRCFKEVIKELADYEDASGSKINYNKTKGLWAGSWKDRRVPPMDFMDIKWTNKNVKNLGVYFGNDNPALATYNMITPNFIKNLHYWKQFSLSQIGKARVAEIYLASRLIYAMNFYPIPLGTKNTLQKNIFNFVNYPHKTITIAQQEMWKTRECGGIKLINLDVKSQSAQAKWLIKLVSNENFILNLNVFSRLLGTQIGDIKGKDIIFLQKSYFQRTLKTRSTFYKESLLAVANLDLIKGLDNINSWDKEHIFYNPIFLTNDDKTFSLTGYCKKNSIYRYEQLLHEKHKEQQKLKHDKALIRLLNKIKINTTIQRDDILVKSNGDELTLPQLSQKILYEEILIKTYRDHHSQVKWMPKVNYMILWDEVWNTVHNFLSSNQTKTIIWQQIHLNFYTQYSYNKWHNKQDPCPLCLVIPQTIHHIISDCQFTNKMWSHLEPCIKKIYPSNVTQEEKSFGIVKKKPSIGILLRNWVTYLLRDFITDQERKAYHSSKIPKLGQAKHIFNTQIAFEINKKLWRYRNDGNLATFDKFFTHAQVLCKKRPNDEYDITNVFKR